MSNFLFQRKSETRIVAGSLPLLQWDRGLLYAFRLIPKSEGTMLQSLLWLHSDRYQLKLSCYRYPFSLQSSSQTVVLWNRVWTVRHPIQTWSLWIWRCSCWLAKYHGQTVPTALGTKDSFCLLHLKQGGLLSGSQLAICPCSHVLSFLTAQYQSISKD